MGNRYYCDYCDKSFPYNTQNRKKHNEGSYHQMRKNAYYAQFKDSKTILEEERQKKPCYKFLNHGYCHFGSECRCSHKTPIELQYLQDLYTIECHNKAVREEANRPKITKNQHNHRASELKLISEHLTREDEELLEKILPRYELPNSLKKFDQTSLPLSLIPPRSKDFIDYTLNIWSSR